jgi:Tfp pilus assembly protein PilO
MSLWRRILDEKKSLLYPLAIALVANVALYAAVVYPLSRRVASGQADAQAAAAALAAARRDDAAARATVEGKTSADAELEKFYGTVLPPDQSAARRLTSGIAQIARNVGVSYDRGTLEASHDKDSSLGKLTATVTLTGQYRDIRRFIHAIETAPDFLVIENVGLSQGGDSSAALTLTMKVSTYFRSSDDGL